MHSQGVVDAIHDGDTVYVKLDVGFDLIVYTRVRVAGINAPELSTTAGKAARDFVQSLLKPGDLVSVVSLGWDKYGGRIDGKFTLGNGRDLGTLVIDSGHGERPT